MTAIEKLFKRALGNAESGIKISNAISMYGNSALSPTMSIAAICTAFSCTGEIATQIRAILELSCLIKPSTTDNVVKTPQQIYDLCSDLQFATKEIVRGVYLNYNYMVIREETISVGNATNSIIAVKDIIRPALLYNASGIIVVHNHPNGHSEPSNVDIKATKLIKKACSFHEIQLLDHVIIAKGSYSSMNKLGYML
jgi:DNA repair protein RadC